MGIIKLTYKEDDARINIYNEVCNYNCRICAKKLKKNKKIKQYLSFSDIIQFIDEYKPKKVDFIGGEPLASSQVLRLIKYLKENYDDIKIIIGHSNGSILPPLTIDKISISIKALTDPLHQILTGMSNEKVLYNFKYIYEAGIELSASSIFIPEIIDGAEIEKICNFIATIDETIPYHIISYIPVKGCEWRAPTIDETKKVVKVASKYLHKITYSNLSPEQALTLPQWDERYMSKILTQVI